MIVQFEEFDKAHHTPTGENDAYGLDRSGSSENFSPVDVGGLGPTALFAANDQIPCLRRYGLEGSFLFPAGKEAREMAGKSLDYILKPAREGTTWKGITKYEPGQKNRKKRNTVVFAYCTELKGANAVQFFDREDDDVERNIYRSEAATKLALAAYDGIAQQRPEAKIVLNVLAAVDPGNKKVLANRQYKVSALSLGASQWQIGCANIPKVDLPPLTIKAKREGDKYVKISGAIPLYPLEAIKLLNSDWQQGGKPVTLSRRFRSDEALDFLFEKDEAIGQRIETGLNILFEKSSQSLARAKLKASHDFYSTGAKLRFKDSPLLHMLPSLYGLLLYKKGIKKEDYMKDDVFYLGKYFAVVDTLYIQYHRDVRSGNVPMSLLGNDHISLALQNPLDAFVSMTKRLTHPYISWAKRVDTNKEPRQITKSCLRKIADLTELLSKAQLPTAIDDADRAKLLIGYLSYGAKEERTIANGDEPKKHEEGEEQ